MRRLAALFATVLAAIAFTAVAPGTAQAHDKPYCGIYWGSLPKEAGEYSSGSLTNVRAGQHPCFDRLVFDVDGSEPGYWVRYVDTVYAPGSGFPVPVKGGATLEVILQAPAYDEDSDATYVPDDPRHVVDVCGFRTFRQVAFGGSFEGQSVFALGVRARLPFRVFTLDGPGHGSRLVIDVAHQW